MEPTAPKEPEAGRQDAETLHRRLVDELERTKAISAHRIADAFRAVPRHLFLPGVPLEKVYSDEPIPTKLADGRPISSSSQPTVMAVMLEMLDVRPGHRVLEVGAGTGYNAALLAHLAGEEGRVVTLDIDEDIAVGAREHLSAAGLGRVEVVLADGAYGYPEEAPYDRIILTASAADLPPAWQEQLAPGGRIVLPLSMAGGAQQLVTFESAGDHLDSVAIRPGGFMSLRGAAAWTPQPSFPLGDGSGMRINVNDGVRLDARAVSEALGAAGTETASGILLTPMELWTGFEPWLAVRDARACSLYVDEGAAGGDRVPSLCRAPDGGRYTRGLLDGGSLALLSRPPGSPSTPDAPAAELRVHGFGPGRELAAELLALLQRWESAGRPSSEDLRIRVYRAAAGYEPAGDEVVMDRRYSRLVLAWS